MRSLLLALPIAFAPTTVALADWWDSCGPDALTDCYGKTRGLVREVAIYAAYECRVRFDAGFKFGIFVDVNGARVAELGEFVGASWESNKANWVAYRFRGHRPRVYVSIGLLDPIDVAHKDYKAAISDSTKENVKKQINKLMDDKGICDPRF